MNKRKWKVIVTDVDTGENKIISDADAKKYVLDRVIDTGKKVVKKLPAIGAIIAGARLIYVQGFKTGKKHTKVVDTTYSLRMEEKSVSFKKFNWGGAAGLVITAIIGIAGMFVESKTNEASMNEFGEQLTDNMLAKIEEKYTLVPKEVQE